MGKRLEKVLMNCHPKDREIIQEEIEIIKKTLLVKTKYRNYNRVVKYND